MTTRLHLRQGFTLIEIIVTLVISAIAITALLPLLDRAFLLGHEPRVNLQAGMDLHTAMENLIAIHDGNLEDLRLTVGSEGGNYGTHTVVDNRYITFVAEAEVSPPPTLNLLKITLQNPDGETVTRLFTSIP